MKNNIQAIILAAGKSTRFNTDKTKLAETICGQAMILYPTKLLAELEISTTVVVGYQQEMVKKIIIKHHGENVQFAVQEKQEGTGHALACSQSLWVKDHILVLNGNVPLITPELINTLYEQHISQNATISFVTTCTTDESVKAYGRVVKKDNFIAIVEAKDFIGDSKEHCCVNAGIYLIKKDFLIYYISNLDTNNASKEFYITDLVKIASINNLTISMLKVPFDIIRGVNTFQELATVEEIKQRELITYWMNQGVRFFNPPSIHLDLNITIGSGSVIHNGVHLRGNTCIGNNCIINAFSCLENVILENNVTIYSHCVISNTFIKNHAQIGPFAHVQSQTIIGENSSIGNFVEVKNSTIGNNSKAKHLTYLGDTEVGIAVNVGAGTITCNYDGINKHKTIIEDNVFIGSNNTLVAPITIGNNAFTAAGSTLTHDVPADALAIARSHQTNKPNYAKKLKDKATKNKKRIKNDSNDFSFLAA